MFRRRDEEENFQDLSESTPTQKFGGNNTAQEQQEQQPQQAEEEAPAKRYNSSLFSNNTPSAKAGVTEEKQSSSSFTNVTPKAPSYKLGSNGAFTSSSSSSSSSASSSAASKPSTQSGSSSTLSKFEGIEAERRLTVGYGISLEGKVSDCDKLIIYGTVNAELNNVKSLHISESGKFTGSANITSAEISGTFEGDITVEDNIIINSTGRVNGKITYGSIEIKPGGKFTGQIVEAADNPATQQESPKKSVKKAKGKKTADSSQSANEEFTLAPEPLEGVEKEEAVA